MLERGNDVEHREPPHARRMVEREPVRDARAAVVAGDEEALVPEARHELDHVARHRALRVGAVLRGGRRLERPAIAAQVRADDAVAARERRCDLVPHRVRLRVAVQEKERRALAAAAQAQPPRRHLDRL